MLLARENVDTSLAALVVPIKHIARCASGCQPQNVDKGTGSVHGILALIFQCAMDPASLGTTLSSNSAYISLPGREVTWVSQPWGIRSRRDH